MILTGKSEAYLTEARNHPSGASNRLGQQRVTPLLNLKLLPPFTSQGELSMQACRDNRE